MKHLFCVHSSITWLIALQIIKEEQLNEADCAIVYYRNLKIEPKGKERIAKLPFSVFHPNDELSLKAQFWKNWKNTKKLDRFASELTDGKPFRLYIGHSEMNYAALLLSHTLCDSFAYIEEGLLSYLQKSEMRKKVKRKIWLRELWYYLAFKGRNQSVKPSFFEEHPKYAKSYGLSDLAFPFLKNKYILSLPFEHQEKYEGINNLLLIGGEIEAGLMNFETAEIVYRQMLTFMVEESVKDLWVKYHPQNTVESIAVYNKVLNEYPINVHYLDSTDVPEYIFFSSEVTLYTTLSSATYYAYLCKRPIYTCSGIIREYSSEYRKIMDGLPSFYLSISNYILKRKG